jgi:hypothetical protein
LRRFPRDAHFRLLGRSRPRIWRPPVGGGTGRRRLMELVVGVSVVPYDLELDLLLLSSDADGRCCRFPPPVSTPDASSLFYLLMLRVVCQKPSPHLALSACVACGRRACCLPRRFVWSPPLGRGNVLQPRSRLAAVGGSCRSGAAPWGN